MKPQDDNPAELRRVLAIKRYEQPPPGYFENFHGQVLARIRAGGQTTSFFSAFSWEGSWLQRAWAAFETRPVYAGGFGLAICGLLFAGVLLSEENDPTLMATQPALAPTVHLTGAKPLQIERLASDKESLFRVYNEHRQATPMLISAPGGNVP